MELVSTSDGSERVVASLWSAPTGPVPDPPPETRAQVLPVDKLHWDDVEKLYLRLLDTVAPVQYAKLFGVPGQSQGGIDAYARLPLDLAGPEANGRDYLTLQSRRVQNLTGNRIKKAVDALLNGEWGERTAKFYFATSYDLQEAKLDKAIREQTERLAKLNIEFVPWGIQEVSRLLKSHPVIVDDFFGRPWVERFCGENAANDLAHNLTREESQRLRSALRDLYAAVFSAQGTTIAQERDEVEPDFVILNVNPGKNSSLAATEDEQEDASVPTAGTLKQQDGQTYVASRLGAPRQSFRSVRHLLGYPVRTALKAGRGKPADEWLAAGKYRLLVGAQGSGKSSFLRFLATDSLSTSPQSSAIQRQHSNDLPIWLPFGYLCRHLADSTDNSIISAAKAWLTHQSADHIWPLVQRALHDDRLLLVVDGIDEWSDVGAAERALGVLEAFLGRSKASAILSTRPYAVDRLNWTRPWIRATIEPLDDDQRRSIAAAVLLRVSRVSSEGDPALASRTQLEPFLDQLAATPELAELSRSPLFLTLLATTWQGEPLPRQRFKMYARLVDLLVEKHPQMRQRASLAQGSRLSSNEIVILFGAVAYRLRLQDPSGSTDRATMRKIITGALADDEVLGYPRAEARRIADAILTMAEDEFGLIVSHGAGSVGFLHRVVLDHLAGQYLATLTLDHQLEAVGRFVRDPAWRDVLLAMLTAQISPQVIQPLLDAATAGNGRPWSDVDGYELMGEALAANVRLTPKQQALYTARLVTRVETHPWMQHRANLITSLCGMLAGHAARLHLLPIMKEWLAALRPDPSPTMWALRDLDVTDDLAARSLLWGIRHPDDKVKINAAEAIARRFGGQDYMVASLVAITEEGPSSTAQAAAILSIGHGWPNAPETSRLMTWARRQPSFPIRAVGLHLLQHNSDNRDPSLYLPEERAWLLSLLRDEHYGVGGPWTGMCAELVNIAATGVNEAADLALQTLETNGRNGGDRHLAWVLACNAFADDNRFKDWVAAEISDPQQRGLVLYSPTMIPQQWRDDPVFAEKLRPFVTSQLDGVQPYMVTGLTPALERAAARSALLRGLNAHRPYAAARALVDQFPDDAGVWESIRNRLRGDFALASPMAGVAIDVLGPEEGFSVLVDLLRNASEGDSHQGKVVVAQALAEGWISFRKSAEATPAGGNSEFEVERRILEEYDPAELARLCTEIDPNFLMWHIPAVINAWPEQPVVVEFAEGLIYNTRQITSGIDDTIPVAILRAYNHRTDETSRRIVEKVFDLLKHLEPELREVLGFELARSSITTQELIGTISHWRDDPDSEVRRTLLIGALQAIKRHQRLQEEISGSMNLTLEMQWLREAIREELCAYGPELEERRQLAWIGMLLLGDLMLIDGLEESIGDPGKPGVGLTTIREAADQVLVELVAANWAALEAHFGDELFDRLIGRMHGRDRDANAHRRHVLAALATVASRHPVIADMLREAAREDPELRHDQHFLLWVKEENRGDEVSLTALSDILSDGPPPDRQGLVLASVLDKDSWQVNETAFKAIIAGEQPDRLRSKIEYSSVRRALYAQLFPQDQRSRTLLRELENWFITDRDSQERRDWEDTLAIAFGVAAAEDLPAIASRVHARFQMNSRDWLLPLFTRPLVRRLKVDPEATEALRLGLSAPMSVSEDSPIFAAQADPMAVANQDFLRFQRTHLYALALKHAESLKQRQAADAIDFLLTAEPDIVVHNPFSNQEGPLRLAVLDIGHR
jgi:energy-coupling factor transporter ATP-binding protein EcfA2